MALPGVKAALWVAPCVVTDATVGAASAADVHARPPQLITAADTAAAPMRRPMSLLFSFMFHPFLSLRRTDFRRKSRGGAYAVEQGGPKTGHDIAIRVADTDECS
jgi:hypothetical protein